ncbi:hypothetical protein R1flu_019646 [Riccia fluitans]|uniref:Uncharacterized protein n=1 Tax=Riccia fluitans TaxID=41844 RepID=A0ABD1ZJ94_9MARC
MTQGVVDSWVKKFAWFQFPKLSEEKAHLEGGYVDRACMTTLPLLRNSGFTARRLVERVGGFHLQGKPYLASTFSESILRVATSGKKLVQLRQGISLKDRKEILSADMEVQETPHLPRDRCAIITGVAKPTAIGRCLVHHFLENGYKVVGADICELELGTSEETSTQKLSADRFHFVQADISDPLQAKQIVDETIQKFGGSIHVLINNAGRTTPTLPEENRVKAFAETLAVNVNGAYYMSESVLPYMPAGQSSIIHISSTRALQSEPHSEGYATSKAGLVGLTHAQAITLSGKVRVNVILPGWINTDPSGNAALRLEDHEWHPAGRVGVPDDVAHMCLFLCDSMRAGFITGQQFVVDGGVTKKMVYPSD